MGKKYDFRILLKVKERNIGIDILKFGSSDIWSNSVLKKETTKQFV